jgi:alginate O-acetyltransferase complex protein AlgJ
VPRSRITTARVALDGATMLLFLGAIVAPSIDQCVRPDSVREPLEENRTTRPMPAAPQTLAELSKYPGALEGHHADVFGLRDVLMHWNSVLKIRAFGSAPTPTVVLDDRAGWLDYAGDRTFEVLRGMAPLDQRALAAWTAYFAKCRDFCTRNGARYLFVLAPNKETVYPDHVPSRFERLGPSRLDQISAALPDDLRASFLDLRPVLNDARAADGPGDHLYFEYGTHWNGRGAWTAYQTILQHVRRDFPDARALTDADVVWEATPPVDFDSWGPRLYQPGVFTVSVHRTSTKGPQRWQQVEGDAARDRFHARNTGATGPRVLVFSDSFGGSLWALFADTFPEVDFVASSVDPELILSEHPDVVVDLRVERTFVRPPALSPIAEEMMAPAYVPSSDDKVALSLDPSAADPLAVTPGASVERKTDGFVFQTSDGRGGWILPAFEVPAAKHAWLHVEIESEAAGSLLVFRRPETEGTWKRRDMTSIRFEPGRHDRVVALRSDMVGVQQLRLALVGSPARVTLRRLEVHTRGP